jgi:hypothetical protein
MPSASSPEIAGLLQYLRRHWPSGRQILLLKCALSDRETAMAAWAEWNRQTTLDKASAAEVRLLSSAGARVAEFAPDTPALARLKGAKRYIFTRTQVTIATCRPLLAALAQAGVRLMLIKGAARVAEVPKLASERTLRDVDILVPHDELARAYAVIEAAGWTAKLANIWAVDGGLAERLAVQHAVGLRPPDAKASGSVDLHHFTTQMNRNIGDDDPLWVRARPASFGGVSLLVPDATDAALVTLSHALMYSPTDKTSDWALDVAAVINAGAMDWPRLVAMATERQTEVFIAAPLLLLRDEIGLAVPDEVIDALLARIDQTRLDEFEYLATAYYSHARQHAQIDAARAMAVSRAVAAFERQPRPAVTVAPRPMPANLGRNQLAPITVPAGDPERMLTLEVSFRAGAHWGRSAVLLRAPGFLLDYWRADAPLSLVAPFKRRRFTLRLPAALFAMRGIGEIGVQAGSRNGVSDLSVRWIED